MNYQDGVKNIKIGSVCLFAIVLLSFLFHNILYSFSATFYVVVLAFCIFLSVITRDTLTVSARMLNWAWIPAMLAMLFSYYYVSNQTPAAGIDVWVLLFSSFFCMSSLYDSSEYSSSMKIIVFMGAVHSFGILVQTFIPTLYRMCISFLPDQMRYIVLDSRRSGFTTNPGFAVAFISAGIIALLALCKCERKYGTFRIGLLLTFMLALMFTEKRANPVFLAIAIILCNLLPARGMKRMKKYWNIFMVSVTIVVLFFALKDFLVNIPFMSSIIKTIDGLVAGEDVTSMRSHLSAWAVQLFKENPIFGIGWGDYKNSVLGAVTFRTELDVHNIYLQLLCETGLFGFICFIIPIAAFWFATKNAYCRCMNEENKVPDLWKGSVYFSLAFQTFFLIYGLTGNPLYDANWQILYMFACGITLSFIAYEKQKSETEPEINKV